MKHFLNVFLIVCVSASAGACDICSAFSRIQPNDFRHTLGVHFNQRVLEGEIPSGLPFLKHLGHLDGLYSTDLLSETYATLELRGRYRFSDRFALFGTLPFKSNLRFQNRELREESQGIGDPTAFVEYRPFLASSERKLKLMLNLRAGVKFPLGNTRVKYQGKYLDHDFQLGSGSYDFILGSEVYIGSENIGLVVSQLYKKNTENLTEYKFGDVYTTLGLISYRWNKDDLSFSLGIGVQSEKQWEDTEREQPQEGTDRIVISGALRADVNIGNLEFYAMAVTPVKQTINDLKIVPLKEHFQLGINYLIERK